MTDVLLHGDTARSADMRHEIPVEIGDPFLVMEHDGRTVVLTNALERDRIAAVLPDALLMLASDLGLLDLVEGGMSRADADLEVLSRAVAQVGVTSTPSRAETSAMVLSSEAAYCGASAITPPIRAAINEPMAASASTITSADSA